MRRHFQGWVLYSLAWLPVFLGYLELLVRMAGRPVAESAITALNYTVSAALLGVLAWHAAGRFPWPERNFPSFILLQVLLAFAYSGAWLLSMLALLVYRVGVPRALTIGSTFSGWQILSGLWVYGLIAGVSHALRATGRLREREAAAARADALRMRAELQALRGQLNPHFLFNTLHTVSALVKQDPQTAQDALERFAGLMRYVLDVKRLERDDVTLADELDFVRDYLALEQLRLGERLTVVEQIEPDALDAAIPSLTLQPLVENAITHAVAPRASGATITITAELQGDQLLIEVSDDGPGATAGIVDAAQGLGLRIGRQRLDTRYPARSSVTLTTAPGAGFAVSLILPAQVRTAEHVRAAV